MRTAVVLLALSLGLVVLPAVAPTASACCHVRELEEQAGPCVARWEGELFWLQTDRVTATCTIAGQPVGGSVENPVPGPREEGFPWP